MRASACAAGLALAWWLAGTCEEARAQPAGSPPAAIRVEAGTLSVTLDRAPASEVFRAIAGQGKLVVRLDQALLATPITTEFDKVPLDKGVERLIGLLQTKNYRLEFGGPTGGDARLELVVILAPTSSGKVQQFGGTSASDAGPRSVSRGQQRRMERLTQGQLAPGRQHVVARTGQVPRSATHVPEGLRLKKERGEPLAPATELKLQQALDLRARGSGEGGGSPVSRATGSPDDGPRPPKGTSELRGTIAPESSGSQSDEDDDGDDEPD